MLKEANKWIKDSVKPYKYEEQKNQDFTQAIDGLVNVIVEPLKLIGLILFLLIIAPIKALVLDIKNFFNQYDQLTKESVENLVPTLRMVVTGIMQVLTSPLLPFRIILRMFLTPEEGVSVFSNAGLKKVVDDYLSNVEKQVKPDSTMEMLNQSDPIPEDMSKKIEKYIAHKQKDSDKLEAILKKPILTYMKFVEIKEIIEASATKGAENMP